MQPDCECCAYACRYTEWLEGTHVEFTAFPRDLPRGSAGARGGGADGGAAKLRAAAMAEPGQGLSSDEEEEEEAWVLLKRLRHPLLQGWYLERMAKWRRQQVRPQQPLHACLPPPASGCICACL